MIQTSKMKETLLYQTHLTGMFRDESTEMRDFQKRRN